MTKHVSLLSDAGSDTPHVGDVSLDAIVNIESSTPVGQEEKEIVNRNRNIVFRQEESFEELSIEFVLLPAGNKTIDEKREEVLQILDRDAIDNDFTYLDYNGFLSVESVEIPQDSETTSIREGTIKARYLPWPQYHRNSPPDAYEFFFSDTKLKLEAEGDLTYLQRDLEIDGDFEGTLDAESPLSMKMSAAGSLSGELEMTAGEGDDPFSAFGANFGRYFGTAKPGVEEYALEFDGIGSGDYLETNSDLADPQNFTVAFWVNPYSLDVDANNNYRQLVHAGQNFIVLEQSGAISFRVPGVDTTYFSGGTLSTNTVHHVACTYDQSDRVIYVDGIEVNRQTVGTGTVNLGNLAFAANPANAGGGTLGSGRLGDARLGSSGGVHNFEGILDDVRVYDSALAASDIQALVNGADITGINHIAHWPMDEGVGFKAREVINNYDATFGGTPSWTNPLVVHEEDFYPNWGEGWGEGAWGEGVW